MRNLLRNISFLGLEDTTRTLENRSIILANQLNFAMLALMILLNILTATMRVIYKGQIAMGTWRLLIVIAICFINIWLARNRYILIFKICIIFIPVFVIFVFSTLTGFVEAESYFYYPYGIIAFSVIPQLILIYDKERTLFFISMGYYLILLLMVDNLLTWFSQEEFAIVEIIKDFYVYYKAVPLTIFIFLHFAIYYLRNMNYNFEKEILEYNEELNAIIEELKSTQQYLIQSEKMASLGTLTAGVAHEINNPLNFINGGIQIISDAHNEIKHCLSGDLKESCDEAIGMVNEGTRRATNIVKALMTFSYRGTPVLKNADINDIIDNTILFLKLKTTPDLKIIKTYQLKKKVPVYMDKIHQVIMNILDNAIYAVNQNEHMEKRIGISTRLDDNHVVITISNNGPGIPEEHLNQIFDPFFTTKPPDQGAGLGLSICYTLISEHEGSIHVRNDDEGVSFIIEIPVKT